MSELEERLTRLRQATERVGASPALKKALVASAIGGGVTGAALGWGAKVLVGVVATASLLGGGWVATGGSLLPVEGPVSASERSDVVDAQSSERVPSEGFARAWQRSHRQQTAQAEHPARPREVAPAQGLMAAPAATAPQPPVVVGAPIATLVPLPPSERVDGPDAGGCLAFATVVRRGCQPLPKGVQ